MAKYYLYLLFAVFIFINGIGYFEEELKVEMKKQTLLHIKLDKQKLYYLHSKEIDSILTQQNQTIAKNSKLFFEKNKKETIVFSEIQSYVQSIAKSINGKINQLHSGTVMKTPMYIKYPISLDIELIPEDLDKFLKKLYSSKRYLFIDSIFVVANQREKILLLKITLLGYQLR